MAKWGDSEKAVADRDRKKKGKRKIQKIGYLENKKSFLNLIKKIFHIFLRVIIW